MMRKLITYFFVILIAFCLLAAPAAALRVTLVGEINDNNQLVADNEIYEIANNAVGDDLVFNFIAQKVKIVGQVKVVGQSDQSDEYKIITVESFEVLEE